MYNCFCLKCNKDFQGDFSEKDITEGNNEYGKYKRVTCVLCGGDAKILGTTLGGLDPLTPYWSENMGKTPVFVESRSHRRSLMKERQLEIIPDRKYDKPRTVRDRNGHVMTQHQIDCAQKKGFAIPR